MSRSKGKQEMVYLHRNIRKNIIVKNEQQQRPKTTPHRRYFASRGYKHIPEQKTQRDTECVTPLATLQINNMVYFNQGSSPERKNTISFLDACRIEKCKESKIRDVTKQGKIKIQQADTDDFTQMEQFVDALIDSNYFFQKIQRTMIESLSLIGVQRKYQKGEKINLPTKMLGFVLYGKIKMYHEKDYAYIATRGDTLGEHQLYGTIGKILKLKILEDSAILWVSYANFEILRQQTVKQGFRHEFNKMETQLRLSFIKKKMSKQ